MPGTRVLCSLILAFGGLIAASAPANAASGPWLEVSAGGNHTCGISTAKDLYCWGSNGSGQVGYGANSGKQTVPFRVGAAGVWTSVSAGFSHTCGITTAKNLYCWGYNAFGQVGNGTAGGFQLPLYRVGAAGVWSSVSASDLHTCGITTAKNLYCWGSNDSGQIGKGTAGGNQLPLYRVGAAGVWSSVATGGLHTCGITTAKNLYCWGQNQYGQIGKGSSSGTQLPLYRVAAAGVWTRVSAGFGHTCGITTAKNLYCWGNNENGQIGKGASGGNQLPLHRVGGIGVWTRASAGRLHTCGITTAKNLYCWGNNDSGQIGNGAAGGNQLALYRVGGAGVWTRIAPGGFHTCGITTAKNLYCWGYNEFGQIGKGTSGGNQLPLYRVL